MDLLIERIIELQQRILTPQAIEAFNTLKTIPLEILESKLEEARENKNTAFVSTIGHILNFGTIDSDLDDYERAIIQKSITSKSDLEEIKTLLKLFAELRSIIEQQLIENPLVKERHYLETMRPLSSEQDIKLVEVADSYPSSTLWLPTDVEKEKLISLYIQIKSLKAVDHMFFKERVIPDIITLINKGFPALSLKCLNSYLDGKNETLSNLDEEIQAIHTNAKTSMTKASEKEKNAYLEISCTLANTQEEYLILKRTLAKYQYPQTKC